MCSVFIHSTKLSETNQNKNLSEYHIRSPFAWRCLHGGAPYPYVWEETTKGISVRVIQKNVAYSLDTSPSMAFFSFLHPSFYLLSIFFSVPSSFAVLLYTLPCLFYTWRYPVAAGLAHCNPPRFQIFC